MVTIGSLSARRAWIEIRRAPKMANCTSVALREESVDRNSCIRLSFCLLMVALREESVDRNDTAKALCNDRLVALREESVDRNRKCFSELLNRLCRSPRGERG